MQVGENMDDQEMVRAALQGDRHATEILVTRLCPVIQVRVVAVLLRWRQRARGRSLPQEVEDLVQEVFATLFDRGGRVLRNWDPARGLSLKSFVGLVAEREARMVMRTGKRSPFTEEPTPAEDMEVDLDMPALASGPASSRASS